MRVEPVHRPIVRTTNDKRVLGNLGVVSRFDDPTEVKVRFNHLRGGCCVGQYIQEVRVRAVEEISFCSRIVLDPLNSKLLLEFVVLCIELGIGEHWKVF